MSTAFQQAAVKKTSIPELKRSGRCLTKNLRDMFELNEDGESDLDLSSQFCKTKPFHIKEIFLRDNNSINDSRVES
jgi:hypothetical protein